MGLSTTASAGSVHPRPRGEHERAIVLVAIVAGSSPPARGTLDESLRLPDRARFIPARAGNTRSSRSASAVIPARAVHPRPRGEHSRCRRVNQLVAGSSPPARGTRRPLQHGAHQLRFIPARAGNTMRPTLSDARKGGSSPPARGTLSLDRAVRRRSRRFIPARAGNTLATSPAGSSPRLGRGRPTTVHPRPRGEHLGKRSKTAFIPARAGNTVSGLVVQRTPRTHFSSYFDSARHRFIPARAGNTASSRGCR